MNITLIMMGGSGTRFGATIPKQFIEVEDRPVFTYLVEAYQKFSYVDKIVIVCHGEWEKYTSDWCEKLKITKLEAIVQGGENRSHSVQKGLKKVLECCSDPGDVVLIHDVTHPFLDEANIEKCIQLALADGAATLTGACFDTMYRIDQDGCIAGVVDRDYVVSATAPECFQIGKVWPFYSDKSIDELGKMTSVGAMMVANGQKVHVVKTPLINLKITLHEDMEAFKKLLNGYYYS